MISVGFPENSRLSSILAGMHSFSTMSLNRDFRFLNYLGWKKDIRDVWANPYLQFAELYAYLLHRSRNAKTADAKIVHLKPLLPIVAVPFLKSIDKINTNSWGLLFQFQTGGPGQAIVGAAEIGRQPHRSLAAAS